MQVLDVKLNETEQEQLDASAAKIRKLLDAWN